MPRSLITRELLAALGILAAAVITLLSIVFKSHFVWALQVPDVLLLPMSAWLNSALTMVNSLLRDTLMAWAAGITWCLHSIQTMLQSIPWSVLIMVSSVAAFRLGGRGLALLTAFTCLYVLLSGYWHETLNTMTLVLVALPLACFFGALFGVLAHLNYYVGKVVETLLDLMQTVPAFAYLIPLIVLFGLGPAAGVVGSTLFALPLMARNVKVGLDSTPVAILEASQIMGCSPAQGFLWVRVSAAVRQVLMGLNQTIMGTLSMVIFAAIIGGFEDVGWEILRTTRRAEFGNGIFAGLVITLLAVLLDRVGAASIRYLAHGGRRTPAWVFWSVLWGAAILVWLLVSPHAPPPSAIEVRSVIAPAIDRVILDLTLHIGPFTTGLKNFSVTYFLLPIRIGLGSIADAGLWGIKSSPGVIAGYVGLVGMLVAVCWRRVSIGLAMGVLLMFLLLYVGLVDFPWLALLVAMTAIGLGVGGARLALVVFVSLVLILAAQLWLSTLFSLYLLLAAISIALLVGGVIGVLAAEYRWVGGVMRPVNDFLQTVPPFVLLIPLVMFFQIGDFSSFMMIVLYAIVPVIRYTEAGLKNVPSNQIEAGLLAGCTHWQMLFLVKLPAARGELLLGLNQAIIAALAMLAVAALVGSRGLGQEVYAALSAADPGRGLLAGLAIATLAIMLERLTRQAAQNFTRRRSS